MKIGIEVEGRFKGLKTLFLQAHELADEVLVWDKIIDHDVQQIYVSDLDNKLNLEAQVFLELANKVLVTVERTKIANVAPVCVHVILQVKSYNGFANLKGTDQVKFENCGRRVYMFTKEQMVVTEPSDYVQDKVI